MQTDQDLIFEAYKNSKNVIRDYKTQEIVSEVQLTNGAVLRLDDEPDDEGDIISFNIQEEIAILRDRHEIYSLKLKWIGPDGKLDNSLYDDE